MTTIFITGANRGIGLEFTRQYALDGGQVIACCRQPSQSTALQALAEKYRSIRIEALDVGDDQAISALAKKLEDTAIDILINNAGIFSGRATPVPPGNDDQYQKFGAIDSNAWNKVLRINSIAPIMVTEAFMPHILRGKDRKVIMISSGMGSIEAIGAGAIAYRTSKAALNAGMRNIANALEEQKIIVVSFHPGWVKTDMGGKGAQLEPDVSVKGMREVIAQLSIKQSSLFLDYRGKVLPW